MVQDKWGHRDRERHWQLFHHDSTPQTHTHTPQPLPPMPLFAPPPPQPKPTKQQEGPQDSRKNRKSLRKKQKVMWQNNPWQKLRWLAVGPKEPGKFRWLAVGTLETQNQGRTPETRDHRKPSCSAMVQLVAFIGASWSWTCSISLERATHSKLSESTSVSPGSSGAWSSMNKTWDPDHAGELGGHWSDSLGVMLQ